MAFHVDRTVDRDARSLGALATIIAIALPVVETGSDPTQIPVGAVVGPVAAAMLTAIAGAVTSVFRRGPDRR